MKFLSTILRGLRHAAIAAGAVTLALSMVAVADYAITVGSGTTIFSFTCFTTKQCPAHVAIDSNGTALSALVVGTVATPGTDVVTTQVATQYPASATPVTNSATGTTAATTATLPGVSSKTTYLCGFSIRAVATAAATGNATVTGILGGTLNFTQWTAPAASGIGLTEQRYAPCLPASSANTGISAVSAAAGTGGVVSVVVMGYQQ